MQVFAQWANQLGPIYKCSLGVGDFIVITDPDETCKLSSRELDIPKDYLAYKGLNPVIQPLNYDICKACCFVVESSQFETFAAATAAASS